MASLDEPDWARSIAAELLRHVARTYAEVDSSTKRRALVLAAAELRESDKVSARERCWADVQPPRASANPWQVEDD